MRVDVTPQALHRWRATALFVGGFAGVGWEVVVNQAERPTLLVLLAGMMGLPFFIPKPGKPTDGDRKDTPP